MKSHFNLSFIMAMVVAVIGSAGSLSARQIPFTEEYFPDPVVRQWLTDKYASAIADDMIETDKVTSLTELFKTSNPYLAQVEDLRCLRYFTNLFQGVSLGEISIPSGSACKKLKYIDVSGLEGLTKITNNILYNGTKNTNEKMTAPVVEIIADGCPNLNEFTFNNCPTLERVSVKDCTKLTGFYCGVNTSTQGNNIYNKGNGGTKLETLDLSTCPNLNQIWVSRNVNLKELRLAASGREFATDRYSGEPVSTASINLQCSNNKIEDLNLDNFYTTGNNAYTTSVNAQYNHLRNIRFHTLTGTSKVLAFSSLMLRNNALLDINIPYEYSGIYYSISTGDNSGTTSYSTQTREVGPENVVILSEENMRGTLSSASGGTTSKGTQTTFTFSNASTTKGSYRYRPLGAAGVCEKIQFQTTLNRKVALQMWVCGDFNGWTVTKDGNWIAPDDWETRKATWELVYTDNGTYSLKYLGEIAGNYRIYVYDPNTKQNYWLGASHADLVTPYNAVTKAAVSEPDETETLAAEETGDDAAQKIYDISSESQTTYNNFVYASPVAADGSELTFVKDSKFPFTTHYCQSHDMLATISEPAITISYVSGHHTGVMATTGFNPPSAITLPTADAEADGPEMWYNLQGISVDANTTVPGIYLVRKGTVTRKIIVR